MVGDPPISWGRRWWVISLFRGNDDQGTTWSMTTRTLPVPGGIGADVPRKSPGDGAALPDFEMRASMTTDLALEIVAAGVMAIASVSEKDLGNSDAVPRTIASGMREPSGSRA